MEEFECRLLNNKDIFFINIFITICYLSPIDRGNQKKKKKKG